MDKLCFGFVAAITALISLDTLRRLYIERHRFAKEDLNDYDLAFVWRIVIFLVYPLLNLLAMWVSVIACQSFGGYVKTLNYGLLWYQVIPDELSSRIYLMPTLFAGEAAQTLLVLIMLLALLFRPHPFLAMILTYSCTFVLSVNLIVDPLLSIFGFGSAHWQLAIAEGSRQELTNLAIIHTIPGALFVLLAHTESVQKLFAELIRPIAMQKLKKAIQENKEKNDLVSSCNLIMSYDAAGLPHQANKMLAKIKREHPRALLTDFAAAYLGYRRRNYKQSFKLFESLADFSPNISNELKAMFLAAAACCAHANRDYPAALKITDKSLEFDYHCSMSRMIKIDVLLKQGQQDKAADELQTALSLGLDQNIEQSIPIDWQQAIKLIGDVDTCNKDTNVSNPANLDPSSV